MAVYTANDSRDQALTGGGVADTFYTGHNSVIVTGGAGADTIVYQHLPWNNTGHVRDFTLGTDKLDFSALFAASGYTGTDPVADGYLRFASNGAGGTQLLYDPDASGTAYQWPFLVTTLDNISPTGLTWAQLSNSPPPRERVATTDGGSVELWYDWQGRPPGSFGVYHVQKYNAAGTPVGAESTGSTLGYAQVVALSDGGYTVADVNFAAPNFRQAYATVFDAAGAMENRLLVADISSEQNIDIAASPLGGFLITTLQHSVGVPVITTTGILSLYDNSGAEVLKAQVGGTLPSIELLSDGTYRVSWEDYRTSRSLTIDPRNPPDLSEPASPGVSGMDDVAPVTGVIPVPGYTNDTSPVLRFTVTEPGEIDVVLNSGGHTPFATYLISAADVARGYVDIPFSVLAGQTQYSIYARITDADGIVSDVSTFWLNVDTVAPGQPAITRVTDDAGSTTGPVPNGGATDDATPTLQIAIGTWNEFRTSDRLQLIVDGSPAGSPVDVRFQDLSQGYIVVTTPALSNGTHTLSAHLVDGAGNVGPLAASYSITVQPDSSAGQTFTANDSRDQVLTGTSGDDTFLAGHNSVIVTGGGGADDFVYRYLPWNNTGHIRDFTSGVDVIDLRPLFAAAGYHGTNPIADGYLRFEPTSLPNGAGATKVLFDPDGPGTATPWPYLITTVDNILPSGIHSGDWLFA